MNYGDKLKDSQARAAEGLLATKIIDLMDKLRLGASEFAARRWIWELLQNAKDVAFEEQPVSVIVELNADPLEQSLVFKHNGQSFSSDNITSLIHQVSSKKRQPSQSIRKKPTGKFGTGFLSTHLLSEKVQVDGIVKEELLPYKQFSIALDRSATDPDEVLHSVSNSLDAITLLLNSEDELSNFDKTAYNTVFTYLLEDEKVAIAQSGISDLHISLPYTLAFSNAISEVIVSHEKIAYRILDRQVLEEKIELVSVLEDTNKGLANQLREIVVVTGDKASIAIEVNTTPEEISIKRLASSTPRLFCDFPLVGSEGFPFPVIINCPDFNINEPRNGVWLTNKNDKRVVENEAIMEDAIKLYDHLLNFASQRNWKNLYEISKTDPATDSEWLSKTWFDESVLKQIRSLILTTPIINTAQGKVSIYDNDGNPQVFFPNGKTDEIREKIWDLTEQIYSLPPLLEVHHWAKIMWKSSLFITLPFLAETIQSSVNINGLQEKIKGSLDPIVWLNQFYRIMNLDSAFEGEVIADKFAVIPSQSETFLTRSELKMGSDVQNELKDALEILGVPIRDTLYLNSVYTGPVIRYTKRTEENVIDEINTLITGSKVTPEQKYSVCDYLTSLFPSEDRNNYQRSKMYDFSKRLYSDTVPEKKYIKNNTSVWKEADSIQLRAIVGTIATNKNVMTFTEKHGFVKEKEAISFLDEFVQFLKSNGQESQLNIASKPILPNQHGAFKTKDEISLDDGETLEILKQVAEKLGYNIKNILLEKSIFLELPEARTVTADMVAKEITSRVMALSSTNPRSELVKEAFRMLLLYFIEFSDDARKLFSELFLLKHKLYDDQEIAVNLKQAEDVKQLMDDLQIDSLDQMRELLTKGMATTLEERDETQPITTEILASWGITTQEEYDTIIGTDITGDIFKHYSKPTSMMFGIAQALIERAKINIMAFLNGHPDYDVEFMELLAPTVLGGISKAGLPIHVVFRPGDNGEVLFYYPSEKATLDLDNAELWVDDGLVQPFHLTLGRILRTTGINRIPIYGTN